MLNTLIIECIYTEICKIRRAPKTYTYLNKLEVDKYDLASNKPISTKLILTKCLCKAAQQHAQNLSSSGIIDHTGTDWSSTEDRIQRYWDAYQGVAELFAYGKFETEIQTVTSLLGSQDDTYNSYGKS